MLEKYEIQVQELKTQINSLGTDIVQAVDFCESGLNTLDVQAFENAKASLKNVEQNANKIDQNIVRILALFDPEALDLRELVAYLKISTELVRISDHTKSFSKKMQSHINDRVDFSQQHEYATHLGKCAFKSVAFAVESLSVTDPEEATSIYRKTSVEESKSDDLYSILEKSILANLCKDVENSVHSISVLSTMRKLERIADRSVTITKLIRFALVGGEIKHFG